MFLLYIGISLSEAANYRVINLFAALHSVNSTGEITCGKLVFDPRDYISHWLNKLTVLEIIRKNLMFFNLISVMVNISQLILTCMFTL